MLSTYFESSNFTLSHWTLKTIVHIKKLVVCSIPHRGCDPGPPNLVAILSFNTHKSGWALNALEMEDRRMFCPPSAWGYFCLEKVWDRNLRVQSLAWDVSMCRAHGVLSNEGRKQEWVLKMWCRISKAWVATTLIYLDNVLCVSARSTRVRIISQLWAFWS